MNKRIPTQKQFRRPHHIREWAEHRGMTQTQIADALSADSLFRSPEEEWIADFLQGRANDEMERIKATLEAAFPRKRG